MSPVVTVSFACNDVNGVCCHVFRDVCFNWAGDVALCLSMGMPTVVRRLSDSRLQAGIKRLRIASWRACVGNMHWDEAEMELSEALRLAAHLVDHRVFQAQESAEGTPFDEIAARAWENP